MDKITFKNGSQPAINDTNLNSLQTNIENEINKIQQSISSTVVFEGEQNSGKISLNKDITSCKLIKIIYIDEYSVYGEKTIESPVGKEIGLNTIRNGAASFIFTNLDCTISTNEITINSNKKLTMSTGTYADTTTKILKVIAY